MSIVAWIVLGAIAGFIANALMGNREGLLMTIILGIVGAVVGGWLASNVLGQSDVTGIDIYSIVVSIIGAVIVVAVFQALQRRRRI